MRSLLVFLLIPSAWAFAQEGSSYEKRMHQIYVQSYSQEIDDQLWEDYIKTLNTRSYSVVEGDNLWTLSEVFFGDGFFWSKIWSYNEKLTNPHEIKVGQEIRFFTGSIQEAPGVWVSDMDQQKPSAVVPEGFNLVEQSVEENQEEDDLLNASKSTESEKVTLTQFQKENQLYPGAPVLPPPRAQSKPVLKVIPSTFMSSDGYDLSKYNEKGISLDLRPPVRLNPLFVGHTFIYGGSASEYPKLGRLIETENGNSLLGPNEMVYVKSQANLSIGDKLTVMGEDYPFDRNSIQGSVVRFMAQIRITEILKDNNFRAIVYRSISDMKPGAWISQESIPTFEDDESGRQSSIRSIIIGGGQTLMSQIYGQSDVVFLDGGINQGHKVGDILGIYKRRSSREKDSQIAISPTPIGYLKIFRAEPNLSSAFILRSNEAILAGDETGPLVSSSVAMKETQ